MWQAPPRRSPSLRWARPCPWPLASPRGAPSPWSSPRSCTWPPHPDTLACADDNALCIDYTAWLSRGTHPCVSVAFSFSGWLSSLLSGVSAERSVHAQPPSPSHSRGACRPQADGTFAYRANFSDWRLDGGKVPYGIFQVGLAPLQCSRPWSSAPPPFQVTHPHEHTASEPLHNVARANRRTLYWHIHVVAYVCPVSLSVPAVPL